jgi:hypothetical protein
MEVILKNLGLLTLIVSTVLGIVVCGFMIYCSIQFDRNCSGYLKRAADANTIELAKQELRKAVDYIESENLTSGSSHFLFSTPSTDLEFWYLNLKASLEELEATPDDVDRLVASNQLLKLRETLLDQGEKGARVTKPRNIKIYPNQVLAKSLMLTAFFGFLGGLMACALADMQANKSCE